MNTTPSPAMFAGRKGTPTAFGRTTVTPKEVPLRKRARTGEDHLQYRPFADLPTRLSTK